MKSVNNQNNPIAAKVARAAHAYNVKANKVLVGGLGAAALATPASGGLGAAAMKTLDANLSPEAARELLQERKGQLGAIMTAHIQSKAGPVKH
jgi:hypothetical protein